jgi:hypothetical protein
MRPARRTLVQYAVLYVVIQLNGREVKELDAFT